MSFNQMQDAYQKTLKQSQAYKLAAQKKAYSNQMKQALGIENTDQSNVLPNQSNPGANTQIYSPAKIETSSAPSISQNQTDLQTNEEDPQSKAKPTAHVANAKGANVYKQNSITTASPGELTLLLYNACLRFIEKAEKSLTEKNYDEKNRFIIRAQDIVTELMVTLNTDTDVGKQMLPLYDFIKSQLVQANTKNDLNALQEAKQFVADFRDTWKQVIQITRKEQHEEVGKA